RQLRRDLRAQCRNAVAPQHPARSQCALDAGRNPVRATRQVGHAMNVDYYALISKAVAGKDAAARDAIYQDAWGLIRRSHLTADAAAAHTAALEHAILRIEDEMAAEDVMSAAEISEVLKPEQ